MKLKSFHGYLPLLTGAALLALAVPTASASLTTFTSFTGNVGVSVNGGGSVQSTLPNGLTADVPAGSTVLGAYLYTSTSGTLAAGAGGTFNGTTVNYTALPVNPSATFLQAGRADVTSLVSAAVNPGGASATGGVYNFSVTETNSSNQDGEVLVVVYSNATIPTSSVGILDGGASSAGDTTSINFNSNPAGSQVLLSIGDGFSYDQGGVTNQFSTINVDGSLLTAAAGNCDLSQDGYCTDGNLITAGVLGLNADGSVDTSYSAPFTPIGDTNVQTDHELYNISSLINPADGNTITLNTQNTSFDDNIFLVVADASGLAGFNAPPPPPVSGVTPEPSTLTLLGTGMTSMAAFYRSRRKRNN
jgi:hypothetical protein